jgi:hypothetical protein
VLAFALWWGGFTFYASFVIPTGQKVLGNHVMMGFITRDVAPIINYVALIACLFAFLNEWLYKGKDSIPMYAIICLALMLAFIIALFSLYPYLNEMLLVEKHTLTDENKFYSLHRIYLLLSTSLWIDGTVYIAVSIKTLLNNKVREA